MCVMIGSQYMCDARAEGDPVGEGVEGWDLVMQGGSDRNSSKEETVDQLMTSHGEGIL